MQELGYENHSCLTNLGSLAVLISAYYIRLIIFATIVKIFVKMGKCKGFHDRLKKQLFFNEIIMISLGAYFELFISGYLNYLEPLYTYNGDIISNIFSYYSLSMTIIILPSIFLFMLTRDI